MHVKYFLEKNGISCVDFDGLIVPKRKIKAVDYRLGDEKHYPEVTLTLANNKKVTAWYHERSRTCDDRSYGEFWSYDIEDYEVTGKMLLHDLNKNGF